MPDGVRPPRLHGEPPIRKLLDEDAHYRIEDALTDEYEGRFSVQLDSAQERFVPQVAEGRNMSIEEVEGLEDAGLSGRRAQAQALRERRYSRGEIAEEIGISRDAVNPLLHRVDRKKRDAEKLLQVLEDRD